MEKQTVDGPYAMFDHKPPTYQNGGYGHIKLTFVQKNDEGKIRNYGDYDRVEGRFDLRSLEVGAQYFVHAMAEFQGHSLFV